MKGLVSGALPDFRGWKLWMLSCAMCMSISMVHCGFIDPMSESELFTSCSLLFHISFQFHDLSTNCFESENCNVSFNLYCARFGIGIYSTYFDDFFGVNELGDFLKVHYPLVL